ncbi:exonuclease SbcCD subunit D [Nocardioides daphniae]|uniref:Nuclease SbcCD subunit D n=1 Tax=Nocardioides daphniae TaxID=402297 RepID=A0A4P7UAR5_9ACTN|nr:exonuclease SbcCD subunit D [Nocardioides daphniae]QCC77202.1 exonuclease SbcCD subunit D [Nocardioides daphniae]
MKILHTSDWHIGRTFHQHSTADALASVLDALVVAVAEHAVDVVVVAGDVFDSSMPSAQSVRELDRVLVALSRAGATVVVTAGNHDSPARLGARAVFTAEVGVHVLTRPERLADPVVVADEHGPVHIYGIPFLEPTLVRHLWPEAPRTQAGVMQAALGMVRADAEGRGARRTVVAAHTFVFGADGESCESERGITSGGVDRVPVPSFDGFDYVALGHIHGRSTLAPAVRYSGAPLHLSFSEQDKPRGAWLVHLDASGLERVEWLDLPVPRPLVTLEGTLDELLGDAGLMHHEGAWVRARLTDVERPMDPMRRLQKRFPHCAVLEFAPSAVRPVPARLDRERFAQLSDEDVVAQFLAHVRGGEEPSPAERGLIDEVLGELRGQEATR